MYPITAISLAMLCLAVLACVNISNAQEERVGNTTADVEKRFWLLNYGNWCGPGHGGFQDCCGGRPCPACAAGLREEPKVITPECLRECPPINLVDQACSRHDLCTYEYDLADITGGNRRLCSNDFQAATNFCYCDCKLVSDWSHALCPPNARPTRRQDCENYKRDGTYYFTQLAPCFYVNTDNVVACDHDYPLNLFC